ncbi:hypothetical protein A943_14110 [Bacillus sp. CPSM8]|nr:hypothetical protein A943_14110 [Bacillus sp. CPSM8]KUL14370.1 hypothetical protein LI7559_04375 [Bacillus licheniformis LMG 7559]KUL19617.1 hypothetical protein LI6934_01025 [Bacillus licheniformis LMG 6934]
MVSLCRKIEKTDLFEKTKIQKKQTADSFFVKIEK